MMPDNASGSAQVLELALRKGTTMDTAIESASIWRRLGLVLGVCGLFVGPVPELTSVGAMPAPVPELACFAVPGSGGARKVAQVTFQDAASVVRGRTGSRVVHVERYGNVYYVTVATSEGNQTHCVDAGTGAYLGRC